MPNSSIKNTEGKRSPHFPHQSVSHGKYVSHVICFHFDTIVFLYFICFPNVIWMDCVPFGNIRFHYWHRMRYIFLWIWRESSLVFFHTDDFLFHFIILFYQLMDDLTVPVIPFPFKYNKNNKTSIKLLWNKCCRG